MKARMLKFGAVMVALGSMAGQAWAETVCAGAQDLTALQVASLQQRLMVAALTCENDDVSLYNGFVTAYQPDLISSDQALQAFFLRRDVNNGTSDYHAFKTKLANVFSIRHTDDAISFCGKAEAIFRDALTGKKKSLAAFALAQPMAVDASYTVCGDSVRGGASFAQAAVKDPETREERTATVPPPPAARREDNRYASRNEDEYQAPRAVLPPERTYRYQARASYPASSCTRMSNSYLDCYYGDFHYYRDPYGRYLPPPQAYYRGY